MDEITKYGFLKTVPGAVAMLSQWRASTNPIFERMALPQVLYRLPNNKGYSWWPANAVAPKAYVRIMQS